MNNQNKCRVRNCRYSEYHITAGHMCGKCKKFGHGQIECGRKDMIEELKTQSSQDILPSEMHCTMHNCNSKHTHTTDSHVCPDCKCTHGTYGCDCGVSDSDSDYTYTSSSSSQKDSQKDSQKNIKKESMKVKCPHCRRENKIEDLNKCLLYGISQKCSICFENDIEIRLPDCMHACLCKECVKKLCVKNPPSQSQNYVDIAMPYLRGHNMSYIMLYAGQGCHVYVKRRNNLYVSFFMHSDNWGQYGPSTDHRPRLKIFLEGFKNITNNRMISV